MKAETSAKLYYNENLNRLSYILGIVKKKPGTKEKNMRRGISVFVGFCSGGGGCVESKNEKRRRKELYRCRQ